MAKNASGGTYFRSSLFPAAGLSCASICRGPECCGENDREHKRRFESKHIDDLSFKAVHLAKRASEFAPPPHHRQPDDAEGTKTKCPPRHVEMMTFVRPGYGPSRRVHQRGTAIVMEWVWRMQEVDRGQHMKNPAA